MFSVVKADFEKGQRPYWAALKNNKAYFLTGQCCTQQTYKFCVPNATLHYTSP